MKKTTKKTAKKSTKKAVKKTTKRPFKKKEKADLSLNKYDYLSILTVLIIIAVAAYTYTIAPDQIAIHWNSAGLADGFADKTIGLFLMPILTLIVLAIFIFLPSIMVHKENLKTFKKQFDQFKLIITLFLAAIFIGTVIQIFRPFNMSYLIMPLLGLLFVFIGLIMPKFKRNYFIGIRTPWALADSKVWEKTHEFGGKAFVFIGLLTIATVAVIKSAVWIMVIGIVVFIFLIYFYSYLVFKQLKE